MDIQNLHQKLKEIEELKEQGDDSNANVLLRNVQKEIIAQPVKDPNNQNLNDGVLKNLCEKCGKKGDYREQDDLCDFCYTTKHNLNQGYASISEDEMGEERFDRFIKKDEKFNDDLV